MGVPEIRRVGVVGLGAMGAGIAQLAIEAGYETIGREVSDELGGRAHERIAHFLGRKVDKDRMTAEERDAALASLSLTTSLDDLADCDLVVEAIVEELGAKLDLFRELESIVRRDAILATNTSALSVTEIASAVSTPERIVGMHFFNPAPLMPLVEIVQAELSSDDAVEAAFGVGERMGKQPIRCHDTPGFVVNRVLIPLLNDCLRVLDEARVSPEDLDTAMTAGRRLADGAVHARRSRRDRRPRARVRGAVREAPRAADGAPAAHRRDAERRPARAARAGVASTATSVGGNDVSPDEPPFLFARLSVIAAGLRANESPFGTSTVSASCSDVGIAAHNPETRSFSPRLLTESLQRSHRCHTADADTRRELCARSPSSPARSSPRRCSPPLRGLPSRRSETLSVERGRGSVVVELKGSALGRLTNGSLRVTDQTPNDRYAPLVFGKKVTQERIGPRTVMYRGVGLRFRMLGGGYRMVMRGSGIALSVVGRGVVTLDGDPRFTGDDAGVYSLDGVDCSVEPESCVPLPTDPQRFTLGPPAAPTPKVKSEG